MIKKKHSVHRKNIFKPIALILILSVVLIVMLFAFPKISADSATKNPLSGSKLNVVLQNPYNEQIPTEFPNGTDFIEATLSASQNDGSPLTNATIVIDKSSNVTVAGPYTTEGGQIQLRFSSKKSLIDTIQIKLKDCTTVKVKFKIKFSSDLSLKDITDKDGFVFGAPVTLTAQIKPRMTSHIASAKARYIYTRRVNEWGFWFKVRRVATEQMECNDGVCWATFGKDFTAKDKNQTGSFVYSFTFTDENGKSISKSFKGQLKNP